MQNISSFEGRGGGKEGREREREREREGGREEKEATIRHEYMCKFLNPPDMIFRFLLVAMGTSSMFNNYKNWVKKHGNERYILSKLFMLEYVNTHNSTPTCKCTTTRVFESISSISGKPP